MNIKKMVLFASGPISAAILGLFIVPVSTWYFSSDNIGRLAMYQMIANFSIVLFGLGLDQGFVREFHETKEEFRTSLFKTVILTVIFVLLAVILISFTLPWNIAHLITGIDSNKITLLILLGISLAFVVRFLALILRMQERALAYSISQILPKALFLLLLIGFLVLNVPNDFESLILAQITGVAATLIILLVINRLYLFQLTNANYDLGLLKSMLSYTLPLIVSGMLFWALTATDKFFLRTISGFEELGIYSVAFSFAGAALILQSIFSTIWAPQVYKWASEGDSVDKVKSVSCYLSITIIVLWTILGMTTWLVKYLIPENYSDVDTLILAIVAYPLLYTLSEATAVGINITRKTVLTLIATAIALLSNIAGNYLLVPNYGAQGAAISTSVSFALFFIIKTELSIRVWAKIERSRSYSLILGLLSLAILFNFEKEIPVYLRVSIYTCFLFLSIIIFKKEALTLLRAVFKRVSKS